MTHREKRSSPENEAKCQIEAYKRFGNDLAVIEYGLHMVGVGLGGTTNDPEFQTPAIATYPLESLDDIDKLDPERLKKENDPHLRHCLEACRIVKEEITGRGSDYGAIYSCHKLLSSREAVPCHEEITRKGSQTCAVYNRLSYRYL